MCIIAIKNKGINMPSEETLQTMFKNNPDGAGFMYAYADKVHIEKEIQSKTVFLDKTGYIAMLGDFITESDGMIYSNKSYIKREYFYDKLFCCYSSCLLCPIDGYVKYRNGEMADSADDFYLINKYGMVYRYDFMYDTAVPIDAEAYTYSGLPYIYDENNAVYFDVEG